MAKKKSTGTPKNKPIPPINTKGWEHYEYKGDIRQATAEQLQKIVTKAAKAANQRLLRLERAGKTDRYSYRQAIGDLVNRKRYKEYTKNLSKNALLREYKLLRSFLSMRGSTVSGLASTDEKRYQTAVSKGYTGTFDEFYEAIEKFFDKSVLDMFNSDVIYSAVRTGKTNVIDQIIEEDKQLSADESNKTGAKGRRILRYMELVGK